MANELQGKRMAFLAADMVEQVELTEPWKAVERQEEHRARLAEGRRDPGLRPLRPGRIVQGRPHGRGASADDYDALVIPGGVGNPDQMRVDENAVGSPWSSSRREAGRRDLPRALDAHRGGRRPRSQGHVLAELRLTCETPAETGWIEEVVVEKGLVTVASRTISRRSTGRCRGVPPRAGTRSRPPRRSTLTPRRASRR